VVRDLDVILDVLLRHASGHQGDGRRLAIVVLQIIEHCASPAASALAHPFRAQPTVTGVGRPDPAERKASQIRVFAVGYGT
jgi:hypothetical protein